MSEAKNQPYFGNPSHKTGTSVRRWILSRLFRWPGSSRDADFWVEKKGAKGERLMVVAESHLQHETTVLFRYDNNSIVEYETYIEIWMKPPAY